MIITNIELLKTPCNDVSPDEVADIRQKLEEEFAISVKKGDNPIGLAAPQIGIFKKMALIRINDISIDLVNAKLESGKDLQLFRNEGCLSFPGYFVNTMRYQECRIVNNLVPPHDFVATGITAVAIQHELDHLNGILLPDLAIKKIKISPNDPCSCGKINPITNKIFKYKKCCGK